MINVGVMKQPTPTYTRQRAWQLKMRTQGRCRICGDKAWRKGSGYCLPHKESDLAMKNARNARARVDAMEKKA